MKINLFVISVIFFLGSTIFSNCTKEDPPVVHEVETPTEIILNNNAIYERLPIGAAVAKLSTDLSVIGIQYQLVAGEGDDDNGKFITSKGFLKIKSLIQFSEGEMLKVRLQAINDTKTFEQAFVINIKEFSGTYPSISSPSFVDNGAMPNNFGANNGNVSPDLDFMDIPENTVSMVLEMIDLDFLNFRHWLVWNIPPSQTTISLNQTWAEEVVVGTVYTGPYPPTEHRYQTTVYFLDSELGLTEDDDGKVQGEIAGKTIAQVVIIGRYTP